MLNEFTAEECQPVEWLVEDLLSVAGTSLLVGDPKGGKSTFLRALTASVAMGREFLGRKVRQGKALYLLLESHAGQTITDFERLGCDLSTVQIAMATSTDFQARDGRSPVEWLDWQLKAHPDAKLVVIDTLGKFSDLETLNEYQPLSNQMSQIEMAAKKSGAHIVLAHHTRKRGGEDASNASLGSKAISGGVDSILQIHINRGRRQLSTTQRYTNAMDKTELHLDRETGNVSLGDSMEDIRTNREDSVREDNRKKILTFLEMEIRFHKRNLIPQDEVLKELSGKQATKLAVLRDLIDSGKVNRCGAGKKGSPYTICLPFEHKKQNNVAPKGSAEVGEYEAA